MIRILSYFLRIIYLFTELFVFGCAGSLLMHGLFSSDGHHTVAASGAVGASSRSTGSAVVAPGLWSAGSVVAVHRLSCSAAFRVFPDQGSNPRLLHWQADSLPLSHQGNHLLPHCELKYTFC